MLLQVEFEGDEVERADLQIGADGVFELACGSEDGVLGCVVLCCIGLSCDGLACVVGRHLGRRGIRRRCSRHAGRLVVGVWLVLGGGVEHTEREEGGLYIVSR